MYLIVRKQDNKIILSSNNAVDESYYEEQGMYVVEIANEEYRQDMVGGILYGSQA